MDHLIITVGVGEGVAHGIHFSTKRNRPHRVYYVLTPESKEKTLSEVRQLNRDSSVNLEEEEVLLEEPDNLGKVIDKVNVLL